MPNYVNTTLTIRGGKELVEKVMSEIRDGNEPVSFDKICPIDKTKYVSKVWADTSRYGTPESPYYYNDSNDFGEWVEKFDKPSDEVNDQGDHLVGTSFDWYKAHNACWGTKWGACDAGEWDLSCGGIQASIFFQTAWSVPVQLFEAFAAKYPELDFDVYGEEEGQEFYACGHGLDGIFSITFFDWSEVFTAKLRKAAMEDYMRWSGIDSSLYDVDALIDDMEVQWQTEDASPLENGDDPDIEVVSLDEDVLERYRRQEESGE